MTDGGVYDNMGDQWATGFEDRLRHWPGLGTGRLTPNRLIVINASARVPWSPVDYGTVPWVGEVTTLAGVVDVMYINTTNRRRQEITRSFNPDHPNDAKGLPGALIQISQSPFVVAEAFSKGNGPAAARAKDVLALLGNTEDTWAKIAQDNAKVATTLSKLGTDVSARLVYQGYVVAMCNLHVIFGEEFPLCPSEIPFDRFRELVGARVQTF